MVDTLAKRLATTRGRLLPALGLSSTTLRRRALRGTPLSPSDGARVLGMFRLADQVQAMVVECGDPEGFDAGAWLGQWIEEPLPAFGGRRPAEYMDTTEGQLLVSSLLARARSGSYS